MGGGGRVNRKTEERESEPIIVQSLPYPVPSVLVPRVINSACGTAWGQNKKHAPDQETKPWSLVNPFFMLPSRLAVRYLSLQSKRKNEEEEYDETAVIILKKVVLRCIFSLRSRVERSERGKV